MNRDLIFFSIPLYLKLNTCFNIASIWSNHEKSLDEHYLFFFIEKFSHERKEFGKSIQNLDIFSSLKAFIFS